MIFATIRILLIVGAIVLIYFFLRRVFTPSDFKACGRCDGKGYWLAARGREKCDWCNGSGRLPKNLDI